MHCINSQMPLWKIPGDVRHKVCFLDIDQCWDFTQVPMRCCRLWRICLRFEQQCDVGADLYLQIGISTIYIYIYSIQTCTHIQFTYTVHAIIFCLLRFSVSPQLKWELWLYRWGNMCTCNLCRPACGGCTWAYWNSRPLSHSLYIRTIYLMILVVVLGGTFGLEQPRNSHLEFYPMFIEFLDILYKTRRQSAAPHIPIQYAFFSYMMGNAIWLLLWFQNSWRICGPNQYPCLTIQVFRVGWWMAHYAAATPKRHFGYSNSPYIRKLDKGVLQWKNRGGNQKRVQTAVSYKSKSGKACYKGTAALKQTEILVLVRQFFSTIFHHIFSFKIQAQVGESNSLYSLGSTF